MIKSVTLTVEREYRVDTGKSRIRIDYDSMNSISAATGDLVKIIATRRKNFIARCLPLYIKDHNRQIVRMDSIIRAKLGAVIGDTVSVSKADVEDNRYKKLILVPLHGAPANLDGRYIANILANTKVHRNDLVSIPLLGRKKTAVYRVKSILPASLSVMFIDSDPMTNIEISQA
ncbi:AAA family ATPase, CDC48 subfamily [Candidatus Nitrososphaera gargensis Ga9.2]|uniref:AAA family ATPase, CDC48 subfamily n=1 Tax=Nitrososphaera gargensis (strain Ga9.2) TaxID=1237085 RepID=K0IET3_NITGG|nr:ATPase AAA [Candidatus Nitrososphaera gargensis]AFU59866.1 AAA family ATPase, CDC48 subfamily [Candidatus Nitrososphaera gargensis Ga9.2]